MDAAASLLRPYSTLSFSSSLRPSRPSVPPFHALTFVCRNTPIKHPSSATLHPRRLCLSRATAAFVDGRHLLTRRLPTPIGRFRLSASPNTDDGHSAAVNNTTDSSLNDNNNAPAAVVGSETVRAPLFSQWSPPRYLWRGAAVFILAGQVILRALKGKIHQRNTLQQLERVGPKSTGVCFLTAAFVGMAFTIQFVREFTRLGLNRSVGGVLALAFSRELSPVVTSIIVAGRIGSAFAAELGTMQVSEQTDTLRVLGADPVDYLVTPRVIACCIALPILTLMCFCIGMASSAILADAVYGVSINIILDSARRALRPWDIISAMIKSYVFGGIIAIVSCAWGVTTLGGAKGVGESTTSAVVISLVSIFIADFILSYCFFQGAGDSLKYAMG
ncbi:Protein TRIGALACTOSYLDIACYLGLYCEROL 1, chloroplastic [Asimina triloba]